MIKETTRKINFLAYNPKKGRQKDERQAPTVNVFADAGRIQFGRYALEQMAMEGKFVRFYYEPIKKIIGWKVCNEVINQKEMKLWKVCNSHSNGVWQVSIKKMLEQFQGKEHLAVKYKNVQVKKYRETGIMSLPNDTYYYVVLQEEEEDN